MTRIIVGVELARNETFLKAVNDYFSGSFTCGLIMLKLPISGWLRDTVAWPLWKYHQVFHQDKVIDMVKPLVAKRMRDHSQGLIAKDRFDALTCTLDMLDDFPFSSESKFSAEHILSHETLQLLWAAGQSPAMTITTVIFKLLENPEYIELLRSEAQAAVSKHGWQDAILNELPKMDSFIRETHRLRPSFSRKSNSTCVD
jgi:cytochrome P450